MSVIGTGAAASVAQTALNAQQVARKDDKRRNDEARASREVTDRYEQLIQGLEEGDDANTATRLAVDDQVPDHPQEHNPPEASESPPPADLSNLENQPDAAALRKKLLEQHEGSLYRHLDLEA